MSDGHARRRGRHLDSKILRIFHSFDEPVEKILRNPTKKISNIFCSVVFY